MIDLKINLLDPECMPYKKYPTDAGIDLKCNEDVLILPGETRLIPSGICVAIPVGYVGDISPRSSISMKGIVIQGKIDPEYRGQVGIIATNCSNVAQHFVKHERIAQLILLKIDYPCIRIVEELDNTDRGNKGYGSTGNK